MVVKQFPTGSLTISGLQAYLDLLESTCDFVPDLLLVDYADLMYVDERDYRIGIGQLYKHLRGIAVERDFAIATASQANRGGVGAVHITERNVAEDFSKIATADTIITFNQTVEEKRLGLARLHVANSRDDGDNITVLITQNYTRGQFVIQSALMQPVYWDNFYKVDVEKFAKKW